MTLHRFKPHSQWRSAALAAACACFGLAAATARAQQLPNRIMILAPQTPLGTGETSVILDNVVYDQPAMARPNTPVSGTADLNVKVLGSSWGPWHNVGFTNLKATLNNDGTAQFKEGGVALRSNATAANVLGTGVDLIAQQGCQIVYTATGPKVTISGTVGANLPYYSPRGDQETLSLPNCSINIQPSGNPIVSVDVPNAVLTGPTVTDGVSLAGFVLKMSGLSFHLAKPSSGPLEFTLTIPNVALQTPIPNLLTQDDSPLTLRADQVTLNSAGMTFANARLDSAGQVVQLAQPFDFALTVNSAAVDWSGNGFTRFSITADLALPSNFTDANGDRVQLKNLQADIGQGFYLNVAASGQNPINLNWNGFGLNITSPVIVDLSPTLPANPNADEPGAGNQSWEGLYIHDAALVLPDGVAAGDGSRLTVAAHNFFVDSHGISGSIVVSQNAPLSFQVAGFGCGVNAGGLTFEHNQVTQGALSGYFSLPSIYGSDASQPESKIGLTLGISSSGLISVDLQANSGSPVHLSNFGVDLYITDGALQVQPDGSTALKMSGSFAFNNATALPTLQGAVLQFTDLGVDSGGNITGNTWLTLAHPATADFGIFKCDLTQLGFGTDNDGRRWIGLSGGVQLADDLALSGQVDLEQLRIYPGPSLSLGGLHVVAAIAEIGRLEAELAQKGTPPTTWLEGQGSVGVGLGPGSVTIGGGCVIKNGSWWVAGSVPLGVVPLGDTGLAIFGVQGGVGHNIQLTGSDASQASSWTPAPGLGNFIVQAGVTMGTIDHFSCWGPLNLTIGFPQFLFDLGGTAYMLSPVPTDDRKATCDIRWDSSTSTFRADLAANFNLPGAGLDLLKASGEAELLLSPTDKHLLLGYPPLQPISVQVTPPGIGIQGGFGAELAPETWIKAFVKAEGKLIILTGELDGSLDVIFDPNDHHFVQADGMVHAKGGVDIWIASAWGEGDLGAHIKNGSLSVEGDLQVCGHVILLGTECIGMHFGPWP